MGSHTPSLHALDPVRRCLHIHGVFRGFGIRCILHNHWQQRCDFRALLRDLSDLRKTSILGRNAVQNEWYSGPICTCRSSTLKNQTRKVGIAVIDDRLGSERAKVLMVNWRGGGNDVFVTPVREDLDSVLSARRASAPDQNWGVGVDWGWVGRTRPGEGKAQVSCCGVEGCDEVVWQGYSLL